MIRAMRSIGGLAVLVALVLPALGERCERPFACLDAPIAGLYVRGDLAPEERGQALELRADGSWSMRALRPLLAPPRAWGTWRMEGGSLLLEAPETFTSGVARWEPGRLEVAWLIQFEMRQSITQAATNETVVDEMVVFDETLLDATRPWVWTAPAPRERAEPWTPDTRLVASRVRTRLP